MSSESNSSSSTTNPSIHRGIDVPHEKTPLRDRGRNSSSNMAQCLFVGFVVIMPCAIAARARLATGPDAMELHGDIQRGMRDDRPALTIAEKKMKAVRCKDHKACLAHVPAPAGEGVRVRHRRGRYLRLGPAHDRDGLSAALHARARDIRRHGQRHGGRRRTDRSLRPLRLLPARRIQPLRARLRRRCSASARTAAWPRR